MVDYNININGLAVNAHYTESNIKEIFIPLLNRLTQLQKEKNRRILVMLAAPPGAGKSTLCSFLEMLSKETEGVSGIQVIGMDGFHRRQEYLLSHTTIRGGKDISLVDIKGAPETFDLPLFKERIQKVLTQNQCGWPIYDRTLHNPVDDMISINSDIVLLEGNYLLLQEDGWDELSGYADYTISLVADTHMLRERLINRKAASCHNLEKAIGFVDFSDMVNVNTCLNNSKKADLTMRVNKDDSLEVVQ